MAVYSHYIIPLPSKDEWPVTEHPDVFPPNVRKPTGRPKKARRKAVGEAKNPTKISRAGGNVKCGNCKKIGHNSRECRAAVTGETPYQRRQRLKAEKRGTPSMAPSSESIPIMTPNSEPGPSIPAPEPKKRGRRVQKPGPSTATSSEPASKKRGRKISNVISDPSPSTQPGPSTQPSPSTQPGPSAILISSPAHKKYKRRTQTP